MALSHPRANIRRVSQTQFPAPESEPRQLRQRHLIGMPHWLIRGLWEMVKARMAFTSIRPTDIDRLNRDAQNGARRTRKAGVHPEAVERISFILGLLGRTLPWRSDCLVQALAGQSWLARLGIAGAIRIGAQHPAPDDFAAHAWLVVGEEVVTGGNVEGYALLIGGDRLSGDR